MTDKSFEALSDKELKDVCKNMESQTLATRVAIFRHLGMNKKLAIQCMEELTVRRVSGDTFDYEDYIAKKIAEFPPTHLDPKNRDITKILLNEIKNYGR